jgi:hypothetical protein
MKINGLIFWRVQENAKESKRVRKGVKGKDLREVANDECQYRNGNCWHTPPAVFVRVANTGLAGYGTWKSVRRMEAALFFLLEGE